MNRFENYLKELNNSWLESPSFSIDRLEDLQAYGGIVCESIFDLEEPTGYIFNRAFKPILADYQNDPKETVKFLENTIFDNESEFGLIDKFSSGDLPGNPSQTAHDSNPIEIRVGYGVRNDYNPYDGVITLSLNRKSILLLGFLGLENTPVIKKYPSIAVELNKTSIRGTIAHELSHWMDDTFHNRNLRTSLNTHNRIQNQQAQNTTKAEQQKIKFEITSDQEIDAQVHAFVEIKRLVGDEEWDRMTFRDLYQQKGNFQSNMMRVNILPEEDVDDYLRKLTSRMHREGILGAKMRPGQIFKIK